MNTAKLLAAEVAHDVTDQALQVFGGRGFDRDLGLVDDFLDTRLFRRAGTVKWLNSDKDGEVADPDDGDRVGETDVPGSSANSPERASKPCGRWHRLRGAA